MHVYKYLQLLVFSKYLLITLTESTTQTAGVHEKT